MRKNGFTLLELIVVIIIVGILAGLAFPRYMSMIESSRSVEALTMLKYMRQSAEQCYSASRTYLDCVSSGLLNIDTPNNNPNRHFQYFGVGASQNSYMISAVRNTFELGITDPGSGRLDCQTYSITYTNQSAIVLCGNQTSVEIVGGGFYRNLK